MSNTQNSIAIIPARGGSKRLPRKNVQLICGKPLIAWTIEAAKNCRLFDTILVSSDDEETLRIAADFGVTPLPRPAELASDTATTLDVVLHVLDNQKLNGRTFDSVALLQATSPLRDAQDIRSAYAKYRDEAASCVVSVSPVEHPPEWCMELDAHANIDKFAEKLRTGRSQDFPPRFRLNGAICITNVDFLLRTKSFFPSPAFAYVMEPEKSIDIDTAIDFELCRCLLEKRLKNSFLSERP